MDEVKGRDRVSQRRTATAAVDFEVFQNLNRLFVRSLRRLGDLGEAEKASEIAAEAWSLLREVAPAEAERHNGVLHYLTRTKCSQSENGSENEAKNGSESGSESVEEAAEDFDLEVRHLVPAERHELILKTYHELKAGQGFILINDHDPKPLYYQFAFEYPDKFTWDSIEAGPEVWRVRIGKPA